EMRGSAPRPQVRHRSGVYRREHRARRKRRSPRPACRWAAPPSLPFPSLLRALRLAAIGGSMPRAGLCTKFPFHRETRKMLDPRLYREEIDRVRLGLERRGAKVDLDAMVNLDIEKRKINVHLDQLKSERNAATERISQLKRAGQDAGAAEEARAAIEKTRAIGDEIKTLQDKFDDLETRFRDMALLVPNIPHPSVPEGRSAADNKVVREWGEKPSEGAPKPKHHLDVGKELGLFDFDRGAKISGSGFPIYTGPGARLERALLNFFLDTHVADHGFTEVSPPFLVNKASMIGTGQLP